MSVAGNIAVKQASKYRKAKAHETQAAAIKAIHTQGRRKQTASAPKAFDKSRQSLEGQLQASKRAVDDLYKQVAAAMKLGRRDQAMTRMALLVHHRGRCIDLAHEINNALSLPALVERDETYTPHNTGKAANPLAITAPREKPKAKPRAEQHTVSGTVKAGRSWVK